MFRNAGMERELSPRPRGRGARQALGSAPVPPFVLFCTPRTGSYHFVSLLASAPDVDCHGEVFKPGRAELAPQVLAALGTTPGDAGARDADPLRFVERLRALTPPSRAFGFKLFANHVGTHKALRDAVLLAPAWRKIVL